MTTAPAPALYPPTFTPPKQQLGTLRFLLRCAHNPLATVPEPAYREPFMFAKVARGPQIVWLCDPDLIERILVDDAAIYRKTDIESVLFGPVIGDGVLTAEGSDWRWQRRILAPLFRPREVLTYVHDMEAAAAEQITRWRTAAGQRTTPVTREIEQDMTAATYDVIVRTMLFGGRPKDVSSVMEAGKTYLSGSSWVLGYAMLNLPRWLPHPATWKLHRAARVFRQSVAAIIAERRTKGGETHDLLGRLLAARDPETDAPMTEAQLIDNLATLLEAGHETTAKALTWTLYLLARSPDWQQRVRDEIAAVAGDRPITADSLGALQITERVIKETLRLYPPAPVMSRTPTARVDLAGNSLHPGDPIFMPIYAIHRHHALWEDPDRFDPDRFLPEREELIKRTQFMPFGAGPRICLGASFAMIEAKVLLANFIRAARFDWDGHHLPEPVSRVTLHPRGGMPLRVTLL